MENSSKKMVLGIIISALVLISGIGIVGYQSYNDNSNDKENSENIDNNDKPNDEFASEIKDQLKVLVYQINIRKEANEASEDIGDVHLNEIYDVYDIVNTDNYTWYKIKKDNVFGWIANKNGENWLEYINTYKISLIYDEYNTRILELQEEDFTNLDFKKINPSSLKNGYEFIGWYLNEKVFDFSKIPTSNNIKLVAKYQKTNDESHLEKYKEFETSDMSAELIYELDKKITTTVTSGLCGTGSFYYFDKIGKTENYSLDDKITTVLNMISPNVQCNELDNTKNGTGCYIPENTVEKTFKYVYGNDSKFEHGITDLQRVAVLSTTKYDKEKNVYFFPILHYGTCNNRSGVNETITNVQKKNDIVEITKQATYVEYTMGENTYIPTYRDYDNKDDENFYYSIEEMKDKLDSYIFVFKKDSKNNYYLYEVKKEEANNNDTPNDDKNDGSIDNTLTENEKKELQEKVNKITNCFLAYYSKSNEIPNQELLKFAFELHNNGNNNNFVKATKLDKIFHNYFANNIILQHENLLCCEKNIYNYDKNNKLYSFDIEHPHFYSASKRLTSFYIENITKSKNKYIVKAKVIFSNCGLCAAPIMYYANHDDLKNSTNNVFIGYEPTEEEIRAISDKIPTTTYTFIKENDNLVLESFEIDISK